METERHQHLKLASIAVLRTDGFSAAASEVSCPISKYRADVAAFRAPLGWFPKQGRSLPIPSVDRPILPIEASTVIVECKQSRSDFLRDSRSLDDLLAERGRLDRIRKELEEKIIRAAEPHLAATGNLLFPELEAWDFGSSGLPSYRRVLRRLRHVDKLIYGQTKFWTMARYALADGLLICTPPGLLRLEEVPLGWGLMEIHTAATSSSVSPMSIRAVMRLKPCSSRPMPERHRTRLVQNIAVAATRDAWRGRLPVVETFDKPAQAPADSPTA